jgi:hypothetical protein
MTKWFLSSPYFWILVVAVLVTTPLFLAALKAPRIVEVDLVPNSEERAKISCKSSVTKSHQGRVLFDFCADLSDSGVQKASLRIRPETGTEFFDQIASVENGHVTGVGQLGSVDFPIMGDQNYTFELVDTENKETLVSGKIIARANELAVGPPWLIVVLGALASVIQIAQACFMAFWRRNRGVI